MLATSKLHWLHLHSSLGIIIGGQAWLILQLFRLMGRESVPGVLLI